MKESFPSQCWSCQLVFWTGGAFVQVIGQMVGLNVFLSHSALTLSLWQLCQWKPKWAESGEFPTAIKKKIQTVYIFESYFYIFITIITQFFIPLIQVLALKEMIFRITRLVSFDFQVSSTFSPMCNRRPGRKPTVSSPCRERCREVFWFQLYQPFFKLIPLLNLMQMLWFEKVW